MAMVGDMRLITAAMATGLHPLQLTVQPFFTPLCLHLFPAVHITILEQLQFAFHYERVQELQLYYIRTIDIQPWTRLPVSEPKRPLTD